MPGTNFQPSLLPKIFRLRFLLCLDFEPQRHPWQRKSRCSNRPKMQRQQATFVTTRDPSQNICLFLDLSRPLFSINSAYAGNRVSKKDANWVSKNGTITSSAPLPSSTPHGLYLFKRFQNRLKFLPTESIQNLTRSASLTVKLSLTRNTYS